MRNRLTNDDIVSSIKYYTLYQSIIELMSLKRGISGKKSLTVTPPDTTYTEPVNCQWDTCMKQFSCIAFLLHHIEKTHMSKENMEDYVCLWKNCHRNKKPYKARYSLIYHLRNHTGDKPHRCPVSPPTVTTCFN